MARASSWLGCLVVGSDAGRRAMKGFLRSRGSERTGIGSFPVGLAVCRPLPGNHPLRPQTTQRTVLGFLEAPSLGREDGAMADSRGTHPSQRRYPPELRDRAVRMVLETFEQTGTRTGVITRIARQLGIGTESLRSWVRQAEVDGGLRPGTSSQEKERIAALEREVRELRRTNEILRTASAFFAAELDGRRPR